MKTLTIVTLLALTAAAPAFAATADSDTCRTLGAEVGSALSSAGGDVTEARAEQRAGLAACSQGLYANGVGHYHKALSLLGK